MASLGETVFKWLQLDQCSARDLPAFFLPAGFLREPSVATLPWLLIPVVGSLALVAFVTIAVGQRRRRILASSPDAKDPGWGRDYPGIWMHTALWVTLLVSPGSVCVVCMLFSVVFTLQRLWISIRHVCEWIHGVRSGGRVVPAGPADSTAEWIRRGAPSTSDLHVADADLPTVAFCCPNLNEHWNIEPLLHSIAEQDYPEDKLSIEVMDQSDKDASIEAVQAVLADIRARHPGLRDAKRVDRKNTRDGRVGNLIRELNDCTCDCVVVLDADHVLHPLWTRIMVAALMASGAVWEENSKAAAAPGVEPNRALLGAQSRLVQRLRAPGGGRSFIRWLQGVFFDVVYQGYQIAHANDYQYAMTIFLGSGGMFVTRALREVGWNPRAFLCEDGVLTIDSWLRGYRILYVRQAATHEDVLPTLDAFRKQQIRWHNAGVILSLASGKPEHPWQLRRSAWDRFYAFVQVPVALVYTLVDTMSWVSWFLVSLWNVQGCVRWTGAFTSIFLVVMPFNVLLPSICSGASRLWRVFGAPVLLLYHMGVGVTYAIADFHSCMPPEWRPKPSRMAGRGDRASTRAGEALAPLLYAHMEAMVGTVLLGGAAAFVLLGRWSVMDGFVFVARAVGCFAVELWVDWERRDWWLPSGPVAPAKAMGRRLPAGVPAETVKAMVSRWLADSSVVYNERDRRE